ncbi:NAD-dependent epimerase/dehydratase family protein [Candidatus Magnetomonas plexicatena]|uniref:NAD-dependent epimerase/dehydratase family protein n=1 Tax=Candidatus Magnetomonas plexicatena TaxID=2552947 RepID=UPI001C7903AC|nr:NAD-dependent epimerase/dehydratase family protein [Nitrospirales bacterium LBB_01]
MLSDEILKSFYRKNVLVTGGTGLIGRKVVRILEQAQAHIKIVSLDTLKVSDSAQYVYGDLSDFNLCKELTKDMDYVFHLAGVQGNAYTSKAKPASHFVPILMVNTNVLEAARINKVGKVVYVSTIGIYEEAGVLRESDFRCDSAPMDFAGWAKRMGELQIGAYKTQYGYDNFSIVCPAHVYGEGDNFDPKVSLVIPALLYRLSEGQENPLVVWGDGSAVRDFVYSGDVAEGIVLAMYHGTHGELVNLGSGIGTSIRELIETLHTFIPFEYRFDSSKPTGVAKRVMDISRAKTMIGYNPQTSLYEGLKITWDWYINNPDEHLKKKNHYADD